MVFSSAGCYYGVLNVIDPTIRYDANGKVIEAMHVPEEGSPPNDSNHYGRDDPNAPRDRRNIRAEEIVIVETVESVPSPLEDDHAFHPEVTYVSESMLPETTGDDLPCLIEPVEDPGSEPFPEVDQESGPRPEVWSVPAVDDHEESVQVNYVEASPDSTHVNAEPTSPPFEGLLDPTEASLGDIAKNREVVRTDEPKQEANGGVQPAPEQESGSQPSMEPATDPAPEAAQEQVIERTEQLLVEQTEKPVVDLLQEQQEPVVDLVEEHEPVVDLVKEPVADFEPVTAPEEQQVAAPESAPELKPIIVDDPERSHSVVLVADYMDATPLFKTVQRRNWQAVLFFLRTGTFSFSPLTGSAMMSAVQEQAQTWVSKRDETGKELWRQLPLHAAICFGASQKVVEKLIIAYPEALKSPDRHGNLPLHLAYIFDADDKVLSLLMRTFPAGLHVMNFQGFQPIQCSNEISSAAFQYNAELFGALSDYTRAVAENDPDKLTEQLQEVRKQLKSVNDTLFAASDPRKPEPIKEYMKAAPLPNTGNPPNSMVEYGPQAFIREVAFGLCPMAGVHKQVEEEIIPSSPRGNKSAPKEIIVLDDVPMPESEPCRVMEYCPETKTWKEV